jgi:hypothetical protein
MQFNEEITKAFRIKGGRYGANYTLFATRIKEDNHTALKHICVKEKWLIGNVIDYLLEGFIADYRQFWPVNGAYQIQLNDLLYEEEEEPRTEETTPNERARGPVYREPEYTVTARESGWFPARIKVRKGEDVAEEVAILQSCLERAEAAGDDTAIGMIRKWMQLIEGMVQR